VEPVSAPAGSPAAAPPAPPGRGLAVVLLVAVALFAPFFFQGKVFLAADTLRNFLPWRSLAPAGPPAHNMLITDPVNANFAATYNRQLKGGGLAKWDPYLLTGMPATEVTAMSGAPGRSSPLKLLLHRLLPVHVAFMLLNFVNVLLMGGTLYWYLREVGAGERGAIFGAVAFMCNGYLMVWLEFESVASSAALVPLMLLVLERYRGPRRLLAACAGGLVLGAIGLIGMLQYVIYTWVLLGAYLVFLMARELRDRGAAAALRLPACFAVSAVGGVLISCVSLLPTQELIASSSRIDRAFSFAGFFQTLGTIPGRWLPTLVFPNLFGSPPLQFNLIPGAVGEYTNYNEMCLYLGVPVLFALLAAPAAWRRGHALFFLGAAAATLAMLAGSFLYYPLFALVPGMNRMNPLRLIFVVVLAAPIAGAFGVRALEELGERGRRVCAAVFVAFAAAVAAFGLAAARPGLARWLNREVFATGFGGAESLLARLAELRAHSSPVIAKPLLLTLAAAALFLLFTLHRRLRTAAFALLIALLAYDLISFGWWYNTFAKPEELYPVTPAVDFLRSQPGPFRIIADARKGFLTNSFKPFGIQDVGGYSSFYPERAGRLLAFAEYGPAALQGQRFDRWVTFSNLGSPLFDFMNVKYLLTAPGVETGNARFRPVYRGEVTIFENTAALPRATVVSRAAVRRDPDEILAYLGSGAFDPRAEVVLEEDPPAEFLGDPARQELGAAAQVDRYLPDEVSVTATTPARGWLVLADAYYRGWEATVDGKPTPILRANCNFRAVPLRAGSHRVVFSYRPAVVTRGRLLTALGAILMLGGVAALAVRERRAAGAGRAADAG
jgi:hypothetical protein